MKWRQVQEALRRDHAAPPMPAAAAFWTRFRARAIHERPLAVRPATRRGAVWRLGWAAVAATAMALVAVVMLPRNGDVPVAHAPPHRPGFQEIDVFVPYSSMVIIEDDQRGGSILWLAGLEIDNGA